jgi:hypothetical protein
MPRGGHQVLSTPIMCIHSAGGLGAAHPAQSYSWLWRQIAALLHHCCAEHSECVRGVGTHWLVCVLVPALILALLGLVLLGLVHLGALGAVAANVWLAGVAGVAHCSSNMGQASRGVSAVCGSCCVHNACTADCVQHTAMHGAHPAQQQA